jgi:hypothetical protein
MLGDDALISTGKSAFGKLSEGQSASANKRPCQFLDRHGTMELARKTSRFK